MPRRSWWLLPLALGLAGCAGTGPRAATPTRPRAFGYHFSGDNIVFDFRPRDYTYVTSGETGEWIRLSDLRIVSVAVGGEFNRWSVDRWPLTRSGEWWVASRPIHDLDSGRRQLFKFVINGRFWAEPPAGASNRVLAGDGSRVANLSLEIDRPRPGSAE